MDTKQNPQVVNLNVDPNLYYINNINLQLTGEELILNVHSGNQIRLFAMSLSHAKRVSELLNKFLASGSDNKNPEPENSNNPMGFTH